MWLIVAKSGCFRRPKGEIQFCGEKGGDGKMFMGEYQHSIDAKGRLIVPAKFREGLGERFVVTKGLDNCLFA